MKNENEEEKKIIKLHLNGTKSFQVYLFRNNKKHILFSGNWWEAAKNYFFKEFDLLKRKNLKYRVTRCNTLTKRTEYQKNPILKK